MKNNPNSFWEDFFELYSIKRYKEALDLVNFHIEEFPVDGRALFGKACIQSVIGESENSIKTLEAMLEKDICIPGLNLEEDLDLASLREIERYTKLIETNNILRRKKMELLSSTLTMPVIENHNSEYIIYYLHGNTRNGMLEKELFINMPSIQETMYFPDAPEQGFDEGAYLWNDEDAVYDYLTDIILKHRNQFNKKVILAGFSRGARVAFKIAYEKKFAIDGIIAFAPAFISDVDAWEFLSDTLSIPSEIIVGKEDNWSYPYIEKLCKKMTAGKIPVQATVIGNLGHKYPDNYEEYFADALKRIKLHGQQ